MCGRRLMLEVLARGWGSACKADATVDRELAPVAVVVALYAASGRFVVVSLAGLAVASFVARLSAGPVQAEPAVVDFGRIGSDLVQCRDVSLRLSGEGEVILDGVTSSCPCVTVGPADPQSTCPLVVRLPGDLALRVCFDPKNYSGGIAKSLFVRYHRAEGPDQREWVRVAVRAEIADAGGEDGSPLASTPGGGHESGATMRQAIRYSGSEPMDALIAAIVVFATPDCPQCNWVKTEWAPDVLSRDADLSVYWVDVDQSAGLVLLGEFERRFAGQSGRELPAVYCRGRIYYGTDEIAKIQRPVQAAGP